jgi:hypothetical protein
MNGNKKQLGTQLTPREMQEINHGAWLFAPERLIMDELLLCITDMIVQSKSTSFTSTHHFHYQQSIQRWLSSVSDDL